MTNLLMLGLLALACQASDPPLGDLSNNERFVADVVKQWDEYRQFSMRLQGSVEWTVFKYEQKQRNFWGNTHFEFKQDESQIRILAENSGPAFEQSANPILGIGMLVNRDGVYSLRRAKSAGSWLLVGQSSDRSVESINSVSRAGNPYDFAARNICSCLKIDVVWLSDVFTDPGFSITEFKPIEHNDRKLLRVSFVCDPKKIITVVRKGWVLLDPSNHYILREYYCDCNWGNELGSEKAVFEYADERNGFPILKRAFTQCFGPTSVPSAEYEEQFHLVEQPSVPDEDFALSTFGISMKGTARGWLRYYLLAAGFALVLVGIVCRLISRRWQRQQGTGGT